MRDSDGAVDEAFGELLAAVAVDAGPVLTVALPPTVGVVEAARLAEAFVATSEPTETRFLFVGSDVVFGGVGVALERRDVDAIAATVAAAPGRRCAVTIPFSPARSSSSSWQGLTQRTAWAPRVWVHHKDGRAVLGIDLGDDHPGDRSEARTLLHTLRSASSSSSSSPFKAGSTVDEGFVPDVAVHGRAVNDALRAMAGPTLRKVVIARRHRFRVDGADDLALRLWRAGTASSPDEVRYLCASGDDVFVGVTPERLCRRRGRRLEVDVLAGSGPRDSDGLLDDDKERREHEAVRAFIVAALAPVASTIDAPLVPRLRRLKEIQHLHTPITATLVDAAPVFLRLHPTPAVAGVPRDEAIAAIGRLEGFDRGLYAGAVGVVDSDGEDLQVALRCAHLHRGADASDSATIVDLYAGSGLVAGSDPAREWQELDRKERTMGAALAAVGVVVGRADARA